MWSTIFCTFRRIEVNFLCCHKLANQFTFTGSNWFLRGVIWQFDSNMLKERYFTEHAFKFLLMAHLLRQKIKVGPRRHCIFARKGLYALLAALTRTGYAVHVFTHSLKQSFPEITRRDVDSVVLKVLLIRTTFYYHTLHHERFTHRGKISFVEMHARVVGASHFVLVQGKQVARLLHTSFFF